MLSQAEESLGEYHELRALYQINKNMAKQEEEQKQRKRIWEEYKKMHQ